MMKTNHHRRNVHGRRLLAVLFCLSVCLTVFSATAFAGSTDSEIPDVIWEVVHFTDSDGNTLPSYYLKADVRGYAQLPDGSTSYAYLRAYYDQDEFSFTVYFPDGETPIVNTGEEEFVNPVGVYYSGIGLQGESKISMAPGSSEFFFDPDIRPNGITLSYGDLIGLEMKQYGSFQLNIPMLGWDGTEGRTMLIFVFPHQNSNFGELFIGAQSENWGRTPDPDAADAGQQSSDQNASGAPAGTDVQLPDPALACQWEITHITDENGGYLDNYYLTTWADGTAAAADGGVSDVKMLAGVTGNTFLFVISSEASDAAGTPGSSDTSDNSGMPSGTVNSDGTAAEDPDTEKNLPVQVYVSLAGMGFSDAFMAERSPETGVWSFTYDDTDSVRIEELIIQEMRQQGSVTLTIPAFEWGGRTDGIGTWLTFTLQQYGGNFRELYSEAEENGWKMSETAQNTDDSRASDVNGSDDADGNNTGVYEKWEVSFMDGGDASEGTYYLNAYELGRLAYEDGTEEKAYIQEMVSGESVFFRIYDSSGSAFINPSDSKELTLRMYVTTGMGLEGEAEFLLPAGSSVFTMPEKTFALGSTLESLLLMEMKTNGYFTLSLPLTWQGRSAVFEFECSDMMSNFRSLYDKAVDEHWVK